MIIAQRLGEIQKVWEYGGVGVCSTGILPVILALEERTMFLVNPEESGCYERDSLLARLTGLLVAVRPVVYGRDAVLCYTWDSLVSRQGYLK